MRLIDLEGDRLCLQSLIFLSPRRVSPFLARVDFHARSRFTRSTIPEEKWGTTRSLQQNVFSHVASNYASLLEQTKAPT